VASTSWRRPSSAASSAGASGSSCPGRDGSSGWGASSSYLLLLLRARVRFGKLLDEKSREEAEFVFTVAFWLLVTGFIGARLFWIITTPSGRTDFVEQPLHAIFAVWDGGIVYYGGLLLAVFFGAWYLWVKGKNIMEFGDILICGVALTLYVGRWACFSAGCDHGIETDMPWGLIFDINDRSLIPNQLQGAVRIHPTQLYMSLNGLLIFGILAWMLRRRRFNGQITLLFLMLYPIGRSIVEHYRGDTGRGIYEITESIKLSSSQIISIPVFLGAIIAYFIGSRRAKKAAAA
jgi:phosphatidylglycerol:prolipoprotein diacylglycerol transferase